VLLGLSLRVSREELSNSNLPGSVIADGKTSTQIAVKPVMLQVSSGVFGQCA
jgi:hypothetical protein